MELVGQVEILSKGVDVKCSKRSFWLSVALLFFLSAISWAEVVLTEDEWAELNQILTDLQTLTTGQRAELMELGRELRIAESNLKQAKLELTDSSMAIVEARRLSAEAEKSYKEQKRATWVVAILSGLGAGILCFSLGTALAR